MIQHPLKFEIKSLADNGTVEGLASTYAVDQGGDQVMPGAFARSIAQQPDGVPMLWQHDTTQPIGRWSTLTENSSGLYVRGQLVMTVPKARETYDLLNAKALGGLSIGYQTTKSDYTPDGVRQIKDLNLREISVVTLPMNDGARVLAVKAAEITTEREFEHFLREAGFARARAKLLSKGFVPADDVQRDAERTAVLDLARSIRERAATFQY